MKIVADIEDPIVVGKILSHLEGAPQYQQSAILEYARREALRSLLILPSSCQ